MNQSAADFLRLRQQHPELWHELEILDAEPDKCSLGFKYDIPLSKLARKMDALEQAQKYVQLTLNFEE